MARTRVAAPVDDLTAKKRNAALLASARRIEVKNPDDLGWLAKQRQAWQSEAWRFNDTLGEVNFPHRYLANMLSRLTIFPAWRPDPNAEPIPMDPDDVPEGAPPDYAEMAINAQLELERLSGPTGTYGPILAPLAWNIGLVGEAYLVGLPDEDDPDGELFDVLSIDELKIVDAERGELAVRAFPGDNQGIPLPPDAFFLRIWRRHPRYRNLADAPMSALLDVCEELSLLGRAIMASARSRLNAGILGLPQEMLFVDGLDLPDDGGGTRRDPFMADLEEAMTQPLLDPGHPSTLVPLLLRAPGEQLERIRHILLDRPIDEQQLREREELRTRLATGLDIPAEILLGMSDANHWTAWQIDDQTWKAYLEPLAVLMTESLTKGFLQPALTAQGFLPRGVIVGHDPRDLIGDENEFDNAMALHTERVVSHAYLRRKGGASEADAPDQEELDAWPTSSQPLFGPAGGNGGPPGSPEDTTEGPPPEADAQTAAATLRRNGNLDRLAQRLANIDRELRLALTERANHAVQHTLERAGAAMRRRLRGNGADRKLTEALRTIPNRDLVAAIGRPQITAWDVSDDQLLDDDVDDLEAWYMARGKRAYRATITAVYREMNADISSQAIDSFEEDRDRNLTAGFALLSVGIRSATAERLFSPKLESPPLGEFDAHALINPGVVRESLAVAGGGVSTEPDVLTGTPSGGIATGDATEEMMGTLFGVGFSGGRWLYGDASSRMRPFEPHELLDGVDFASWEDDVLANPDGWPDYPYFFPGDHDTCQCDFIPALEAGE